jgi:AcrR family transcriptional regulator
MNVHSHSPTARGEATRDAIVNAALELFAERGFHGTAVPEVAKRAGVAAGTIYRHFVGKEQLVNVVYRRCKSAMMDHLVSSLKIQTEPRELFRAFFGSLADFARTQPMAFAFLELHHHGSYLDKESRELELNILIPIAHFVEQLKSQGILKPFSTEALISMVWGALVGIVKASKLGYVRLTDTVMNETEQSCWDAIRRIEPLETER